MKYLTKQLLRKSLLSPFLFGYFVLSYARIWPRTDKLSVIILEKGVMREKDLLSDKVLFRQISLILFNNLSSQDARESNQSIEIHCFTLLFRKANGYGAHGENVPNNAHTGEVEKQILELSQSSANFIKSLLFDVFSKKKRNSGSEVLLEFSF